MSVHEIVQEPVIEFSYTYDVGKGKSIGFRTFVPAGTAAAQLNKTLDLLAAAGTRQFLMHEREEMIFRLTHFKKQLENAVNDFGKMQERHLNQWVTSERKGNYKPTAQQESELTASQNLIKNMKTEIETLEWRLVEANEKIGPSTTDSSKAA